MKLALAFRRRLPRDVVETVVRAAEIAGRGDLALANIRLALTLRAAVPQADDIGERCALADHLLERGMTTDALMSALGYGPASPRLTKYDENQPRVPAGSGPTSGQWAGGRSGGAATPTTAADAPTPPAASASTLAAAGVAALAASEGAIMVPGLSAATITALGALAASVGFGVALGLLFVPSPNSTSSEGVLPDSPDHRYAYDGDTGLLRITGGDGVLLAGHADAEGIFRDAATGLPFARMVAGSLVMDAAAIDAADSDADADTIPRVGVDTETQQKPRLCPDPGLDHPSGKPSARAIAYQEQISRMINPQRPLPYGLAMGLIDPKTLKLVHFDECGEDNGDMYDAKGPGYAGILSFPAGEKNLEEQWLRQGSQQLRAAGRRHVVWYFAEQRAADHARDLFKKESVAIEVRFQPPEVP